MFYVNKMSEHWAARTQSILQFNYMIKLLIRPVLNVNV